MTVLAQIFNIMPPDLETLTCELYGDYEGVTSVFTARETQAPAWATQEDVAPPADLVKQYLERPSQEDVKLT